MKKIAYETKIERMSQPVGDNVQVHFERFYFAMNLTAACAEQIAIKNRALEAEAAGTNPNAAALINSAVLFAREDSYGMRVLFPACRSCPLLTASEIPCTNSILAGLNRSSLVLRNPDWKIIIDNMPREVTVSGISGTAPVTYKPMSVQ